MTASLDELIGKLGYEFRDESLLKTALTHRSKSSVNNERLEFLGDAILGFVVAEVLYTQFKKATEGQLSRFRSSLVKKETLASLAREFALGDYLLLGSGELKSGGYRRDSILADAMEAVIGAIYLDGGIHPVKEFVNERFETQINSLSLGGTDNKDPKTSLQEFLQGRHLDLPKYEVIATTGDDHSQNFEVSCTVEIIDEPVIGSGTSRRRAEQDAAQLMLEKLGVG